MTLNELIDRVSRLKGWKIIPEDDSEGFRVPQADRRRPSVAVGEFREESRPMARLTTLTGVRPLGTPTPQTRTEPLEFIAHPADQYEKLILKTDVH